MAVIAALPGATPRISPEMLTVATDAFEEEYAAWLVTSCLLPSERTAVTCSCMVFPAGHVDAAN